MTTTQTFFEQGIRVVSVTDWLDWAVWADTKEGKWPIVLPMIQRGSVWKPHQVIDLWDTLLRGMPFGGFMASQINSAINGAKFFSTIDRKLTELPSGGGLSLLDGQQRTLAMLLAWPKVGTQMNRRLWIDFGEDDQTAHQKFDHLLRFHLTTGNHPFGYQRGGNSGNAITRLSLSERRCAAAAYADPINPSQLSEQDDKRNFLHDTKITPWHSTLPVDLRLLIAEYQKGGSALSVFVHQQIEAQINLLKTRIALINSEQPPFNEYFPSLRDSITKHLQRRLDDINKISPAHLSARIKKLEDGLSRLFSLYIPVIEVPSHMIDAREEDATQDPPLAVLFKRIGTGGTDLKTSDYVFSVIKHRNPECHSLVENLLHQNPQISAIYAPTELVMSAVRLTAAKLKLPDYEKLDKQQFNSLLRGAENKTPAGDNGSSLLKESNEQIAPEGNNYSSFLIEFNKQIAPEGEFVKCLQDVLKAIAYRPSVNKDSEKCPSDIGLPKHALCLVEIAALEVVMYWLQKQSGSQKDIAQNNRAQLIRFLLCWRLTVLNTPKASKVCFKKLASDSSSSNFPDKDLMALLQQEKLALPMRSPDDLEKINTLPVRLANDKNLPTFLTKSDGVSGLRGWRRFAAVVDGADELERVRREETAKLYERWWSLGNGYSHTLLLWLQRDYVHRKFEKEPALPGMEDDTPYDFDHICPQNHWFDWTGIGTGDRLTDFHAETIEGADKEGHWRLGNAIGNVRVWDSSDNRGDGDAAPAIKLKLPSPPDKELDSDDTRQLLRDSAIDFSNETGLTIETKAWVTCSPNTDNPKHWTLDRARAFQQAIEQRTFNLYQRFYSDLKFQAWGDSKLECAEKNN